MATREAVPGAKATPGDPVGPGQSTYSSRGYVLLLCGVAAVCVEGVGLHHGAYPIGAGVWAGLVACVSGAWSLRTKEGRTAMVLVMLNTVTAISLVFFSSFILVRSGHQFEGVYQDTRGGVVRYLHLTTGLLCYSVLVFLGLVILGVAVAEIKKMRGRKKKTVGQQEWRYSNLGAQGTDI